MKLFYGGEGDTSCFADIEGSISDAEYKCYVNSLKEQRIYSNVADTYLDYNASEIISPREIRIQALDEAGYDRIVLWFKNELWGLSKDNRARVYTKLKEVNGFDKIDEIVIVDEPYFNGWSFEQLEGMISEVKQNFPDKKLRVNFAATATSSNYEIPEEIDTVSLDYYPWFLDSDAACCDEIAWKQIIQDLIGKLKAKTDKPITYIAQGFTGRDGVRYCPLTADNVRWSYEVANANKLEGLSYWFPRGTKTYGKVVFTGYREHENQEAEQEIIKIGRKIVEPPVPPPTPVCGNGICDGNETCSTCPADCGSCTIEAEDINSDGVVNVIDVQLCVNVFLGTETTPDIIARADVNDDGSVNVIDVQRIVNVFLGR